MTPAPVAIVGLGAIGRLHAARLAKRDDLRLAAVADRSPVAREWAVRAGLPCFDDAGDLLGRARPAAVIVATPNATHAEVGVACLEAGVPTLMEKPIADRVADAERLCAAARAKGVPLLVGHQRLHSPSLKAAKRLLDDGALGRVVAANVMAAWLKPDDYFTAPGTAWRRRAGGGPVLINLIHDIDMLRHLLGPVRSVQARTSAAVRGFEVEDSAAVLMEFAGGALATLLTSDCTASPWHYDLSAGENELFPRIDADALWLCGTQASLALPRMRLWRYSGARGWSAALAEQALPIERHDPYDEQLRHLRAVIDGREAPVCSGADGLSTLRAAQAVHESARTGRAVTLDADAGDRR